MDSMLLVLLYKTAVLIAIRSINIHQHDSSYLLVPMSQVAWPLAEHICTTHHTEVPFPTFSVGNIRYGGNDPQFGFYAAERNSLDGDTMFVLSRDEDH